MIFALCFRFLHLAFAYLLNFQGFGEWILRFLAKAQNDKQTLVILSVATQRVARRKP